LCGYIFEPYVFELLENGGNFTCRKLVPGNTKEIPPDETLKIPPSKKEVAGRVLPDQTLNKLYVPRTRNYTAIDAWMHGIGAFQMTVGKRHGIKAAGKNDLGMLGNKLFWLLPPLYYNSFTRKSAPGVEQYAVLIPYPE
jgi:hypothetical protein